VNRTNNYESLQILFKTSCLRQVRKLVIMSFIVIIFAATSTGHHHHRHHGFIRSLEQ